MWCLSVKAAILKLTPQTVVLENVEHASHLTKDQHTRSCIPTHTNDELGFVPTLSPIHAVVASSRLKEASNKGRFAPTAVKFDAQLYPLLTYK